MANRTLREPAAAPHWFISVPPKTRRLPGYPCSVDPGAGCRPLHARVIGWRWRSGYTLPSSNPTRGYTGNSFFLPSSPASLPSLLQVLPAPGSCWRRRSQRSLRRRSSDCPERGWRQDCSWGLDHALASSGLPAPELLDLAAALARSSWPLDLSGGGPSGVAAASAQPLPLPLLLLLALLLAPSPRRSSHSPPKRFCFPPFLPFGNQRLRGRRPGCGGEGRLTKCCFDTSLGWKLSENRTTQNKTPRSVAATEETKGKENPVGRSMVAPQRVGKFVEHFLGIRSFLSPIIFLTSEE